MSYNEYAVVAELNNDKQVLLEKPNYNTRKVSYRYLTESEIKDDVLDFQSSRIWLTSPIYKTTDNGDLVLFTTIEANAVVLNRIKQT